MVNPVQFTIAAGWGVILLGACAAVLYAAHQAYRARIQRELQGPPGPPIDYAREMQLINEKIAHIALEARETLERTRETVRRGTKG